MTYQTPLGHGAERSYFSEASASQAPSERLSPQAKPAESSQGTANDVRGESTSRPKDPPDGKQAGAQADHASSPQEPPSEHGDVTARLKRSVARFVEKPRRSVLYGVVGFFLAAFVLLAGILPTILLVAFVAAGVAIGRYRDGDPRTRAVFKSLLDRMR